MPNIYQDHAMEHLAECIDFALGRIDGIRYDASVEFLFNEIFEMVADLAALEDEQATPYNWEGFTDDA